MAITNELKAAGEVDIQRVEIVASSRRSLDIRNQVIAINIFEDIFSPFITGNLVIKDAMDLVNYLPLIGDETLHLRLATPGFKDKNTFIDITCKIFKLSDREMMANRAVGYILHFISNEAMMDLNLKLSKAFNDNIATVAEKILSDCSIKNTDRFHVEPTSNNISYVSNYWSPVKNLNYLADHAISMTGSPTFLFFENRNGLNFASLDYLYTLPKVRDFIVNDYSRDFNQGDSGNIRNIERDFSQVIDITVPVAYDYVDRMRQGTFASTLITHDITTKTYSYAGFDFLTDYDKDKRLNKYPLLNQNIVHSPAAAIATIHKANGVLAGNNDVTNSKIFQKRRSLLSLADSCRIQITVLGRTDYTIGQKVNVTTNRNMPIDKEDGDVTDYTFSGDYIIASIRHVIDRESHQCVMELIKDSTNLKM